MGTIVRLVNEIPDERKQCDFNEKSMALAQVAMVVYEASLWYVKTILLDQIKAYKVVDIDQVMTVVDEEHSVKTAGMVP